MAVRFRKTVSLGKGARVTFSKKGPSLSLGPRGSSVSIGKRGIYANMSIPKTGLSASYKIIGTSKKSRSRKTSRSSAPSSLGIANHPSPQALSPEREWALSIINEHRQKGGLVSVAAQLNEAGEIIFLFTDTGEIINDSRIIREIKTLPYIARTLPGLHEQQKQVWRKIQESSEEASREFIEIYKFTPPVISESYITDQLARLKPQIYTRETFTRPRPDEQEILNALKTQAHRAVTGLFRKNKVNDYISSHYSEFAAEYVSQWEHEYANFERIQDERKAESNRRFLEEYIAAKQDLEKVLSTQDEDVLELVENWLNSVVIPADISAQIDYHNGQLYVDLDLPEIEDIPATTTRQLKSGQVKIINKTKKQLKQEYATCVLGLAFFVAAHLFNANLSISLIVISGYTQRRNKKGDLINDYIYSVKFPRKTFRGIADNDPLVAFNEFENHMKLGSTFAFGSITPYETE